jgi:hypothetical protein
MSVVRLHYLAIKRPYGYLVVREDAEGKFRTSDGAVYAPVGVPETKREAERLIRRDSKRHVPAGGAVMSVIDWSDLSQGSQ